MNGLVKELKVQNMIRFKNDIKRKIIATRIFELQISISASLFIMYYRHDSGRILSDIGIKVYRFLVKHVRIFSDSDVGKTIILSDENIEKISVPERSTYIFCKLEVFTKK